MTDMRTLLLCLRLVLVGMRLHGGVKSNPVGELDLLSLNPQKLLYVSNVELAACFCWFVAWLALRP
jgi:hypothetical protein